MTKIASDSYKRSVKIEIFSKQSYSVFRNRKNSVINNFRKSDNYVCYSAVVDDQLKDP